MNRELFLILIAVESALKAVSAGYADNGVEREYTRDQWEMLALTLAERVSHGEVENAMNLLAKVQQMQGNK